MLKSVTFGKEIHSLHQHGDKKKSRQKPLVNKTFHFTSGLNLLVGENGSGKSSLMESIAQRLLCFNYGRPKIDDDLYRGNDSLWHKEDDDYWTEPEFMPQIVLDCDQTPYAMYASPDFTPRGQPNRAYSLCYGLGKDATQFYDMTDSHSSGEGMRNIIASMFKQVQSSEQPVDKALVKELEWRGPRDSMYKKVLKLSKLLPEPNAPVLLLFDEPERALDLNAQLKFWQDMVQLAKTPNVQIIIATHSVIPLFMRDEKFSYTEMTKGYAKSLQQGVVALQA